MELHSEGCSKNNEETEHLKAEAGKKIKKAKEEINCANELGARIKEIIPNKNPGLTLEKMDSGSLYRSLLSRIKRFKKPRLRSLFYLLAEERSL